MSGAPTFDFFRALPQPPLSAFVESIWAVRGSSGYQRFTMLPNGAVQLMINFGAAHIVLRAGGRSVRREQRQAWLAGLQDGPLTIESPPQTDLLSIRFRPGGAHAFLRTPLDAVTNDVVDASDLFGASVTALREQLAQAADRGAQLAITENWLLARLQPREHDFSLLAGAHRALAIHAPGSVRAACDDLGLSNEHMIRVFRRLAGLAPKTLASVHRFHRALRLLSPGTPHLDVALCLGYYDQPHFNREFARFSGVSPGVFLRRRGEDGESLIGD